MAEDITFTKKMRMVTREIHAISDALINAKLAFAMSDNSVWAEGLLVFYEIFRYLEEAMVRLKGTPVSEFRFEELMRTEEFQKDLEFYLGKDWVNDYSPRESVTKYLIHLQEIEQKNPLLLIAYIYHLYMGLLSGGQILSRKRALIKKLTPFGNKESKIGGDAVTNFGSHSIASIKKKIVDTTNSIFSVTDSEVRQLVLEESKMVFVLNNSMVKSIEGTTSVLVRKGLFILAFVILIILIYFFVL